VIPTFAAPPKTCSLSIQTLLQGGLKLNDNCLQCDKPVMGHNERALDATRNFDKLPKFSDKFRKSVINYMVAFNLSCDTFEIPIGDRTSALANALKNEPNHSVWFNQNIANKDLSWQEVMDKFIEHYNDYLPRVTISHEFADMTMDHFNTFSEFNDQFISYAHQLGYTGEQLVDSYKKKLPYDLRKVVQTQLESLRLNEPLAVDQLEKDVNKFMIFVGRLYSARNTSYSSKGKNLGEGTRVKTKKKNKISTDDEERKSKSRSKSRSRSTRPSSSVTSVKKESSSPSGSSVKTYERTESRQQTQSSYAPSKSYEQNRKKTPFKLGAIDEGAEDQEHEEEDDNIHDDGKYDSDPSSPDSTDAEDEAAPPANDQQEDNRNAAVKLGSILITKATVKGSDFNINTSLLDGVSIQPKLIIKEKLVDTMVDTGSFKSIMKKSVAEQLGLTIRAHENEEVKFQLADGHTTKSIGTVMVDGTLSIVHPTQPVNHSFKFEFEVLDNFFIDSLVGRNLIRHIYGKDGSMPMSLMNIDNVDVKKFIDQGSAYLHAPTDIKIDPPPGSAIEQL
jgi:hypothetical protein